MDGPLGGKGLQDVRGDRKNGRLSDLVRCSGNRRETALCRTRSQRQGQCLRPCSLARHTERMLTKEDVHTEDV
eukprot:767744-Hanusia_phi.AAC.2